VLKFLEILKGNISAYFDNRGTMALYKSAQILEADDDITQSGDEDEVILYDELPSKEDVIEMHDPDHQEEMAFKLPALPGSDAEETLEVSTDDPIEVSEDKKDENKLQEEPLEVTDPWDTSKTPPEHILEWAVERFNNLPRHTGKETAGMERVIACLKRINSEMSKAASRDLTGKINIQKFEEIRREIYRGISSLENAISKIENTQYKPKKKANDNDDKIIKEAKQMRIDGIVITVPLLISTLASVCINGMVSAGHSPKDMYEKLVKEFELTKREEVELSSLLQHMGYDMPRRDRWQPLTTSVDPTSENNLDFSAQYYS
jgi:hypothetical protein